MPVWQHLSGLPEHELRKFLNATKKAIKRVRTASPEVEEDDESSEGDGENI